MLLMQTSSSRPRTAAGIHRHSHAARAEEQQQGQPPQHTDVEQRAEQAAHAKAQGNAALKKQQYSEAIQHYSHAIELEGSNPAHSNNRALAFLKVSSRCALGRGLLTLCTSSAAPSSLAHQHVFSVTPALHSACCVPDKHPSSHAEYRMHADGRLWASR